MTRSFLMGCLQVHLVGRKRVARRGVRSVSPSVPDSHDLSTPPPQTHPTNVMKQFAPFRDRVPDTLPIPDICQCKLTVITRSIIGPHHTAHHVTIIRHLNRALFLNLLILWTLLIYPPTSTLPGGGGGGTRNARSPTAQKLAGHRRCRPLGMVENLIHAPKPRTDRR